MTARLERIRLQLYKGGIGGQAGPIITDSGGFITVCKDGDGKKATLYDSAGASQSNGLALTRGSAEFYIDTTVDTQVDLYIAAPDGRFETKINVTPGAYDIPINIDSHQLYVIPFDWEDCTPATEKDTGYDIPESCMVLGRLSGMGLRVIAADSTETIDVGLGEAVPAETGGDANGFIAASVLDATPKMLVGTNGALFSTNAPHVSDFNVARSITYTLTAGSDTASGFILLPIVLTKAGA